MTLPGHDPRLGPLLQPGAGARRAGDGRLGHLQPGHRPVRDAHRGPAVGGRQRRSGRPRPTVRPDPGPDDGPSVGPARPRGDHPQGARARPARPLAVGRGHGRRARGDAAPASRRGGGAAWRPARRPRTAARGPVRRGRGAVGATVVSATARPNPGGIPYAPDAYADAGYRAAPGAPPPVRRRRRPTGAAARGRRDQPAGLDRRRRSRCSSSRRSPSSSSSWLPAAARHASTRSRVPNFVGHRRRRRREPAGRRRSA